MGDAAEKVILFCVTCDKILVDANKTATPKKKKAFNMNKYKTHDGEKGSPQQWREAAKVVFNVNSENCLKTLGLSGIPASEDALKKHYKAIIRKAHPDLGGKFTNTNPKFWWCLGADQMCHHLTHYTIIYLLVS